MDGGERPPPDGWNRRKKKPYNPSDYYRSKIGKEARKMGMTIPEYRAHLAELERRRRIAAALWALRQQNLPEEVVRKILKNI